MTATAMANASALPLADVPATDFAAFRACILERIAAGAALAALFPFRRDDGTHLVAVLDDPSDAGLAVVRTGIVGSFPSLSPDCPQAQGFEREIAEQWGIVPVGHPWLKPLRFQRLPKRERDPGLSKWFGGARGPSVMDFYRVEGEEVHEVAVGPVHAGVIEPGHFRFQCHGERVLHLEISLGYQHRGIEAALRGGPDALTRHRLETAAGDTTVGHSLAYAMNVEALAGIDVADEAWRARSVALELERIANHVGDLGALAGDVGYLPTAAFCGRLRGDILNLTALLCGNRFGRGLVLPGGVGYRLDNETADTMRTRLAQAMRDIRGALRLLFAAPGVLARFEGIGCLSLENAALLGLVGPAARASGLGVDARHKHPAAMGALKPLPIKLGKNGDVYARADQRRHEVESSAGIIETLLKESCDAPPADPHARPALRPDSLALSVCEGWRGRVCHAAVTDADGRFAVYKVVDPSFHNWSGLAMALRGQQISDFPLCNKSFNLSYCGHDL